MSQLREMPEGAGEIATTLIPAARATEIVDRLKAREMTDDKVRNGRIACYGGDACIHFF